MVFGKGFYRLQNTAEPWASLQEVGLIVVERACPGLQERVRADGGRSYGSLAHA